MFVRLHSFEHTFARACLDRWIELDIFSDSWLHTALGLEVSFCLMNEKHSDIPPPMHHSHKFFRPLKVVEDIDLVANYYHSIHLDITILLLSTKFKPQEAIFILHVGT